MRRKGSPVAREAEPIACAVCGNSIAVTSPRNTNGLIVMLSVADGRSGERASASEHFDACSWRCARRRLCDQIARLDKLEADE
jgi:hypothetical protein